MKTDDWASDPDLSLAILARKLGTNSGHLSRAINEGLGINFATFVNDLRARRVAAMMAQGAGLKSRLIAQVWILR